MSLVRVLSIACALLSSTGVARATGLAFVWWGEPDPSGIDQAFLDLGRRRGAAALRETPGRVGGEAPLSARLAHALELSRALDFKGALAAFDEVEREVVARGGGTLSGGELVDLYAYRGAAHAAVGDEADSWNDLVQSAALAPGRPLDPARFAPRLVEAARRAREALGPSATLSVTVEPGDAVVVVDGQLYGRGHVEVARPPGRHFVRVERPGFVASGRVVELAGGTRALRVTLTAARAPTPDEVARRGALAEAQHTVGAWIAGGARATLTLVYVDGAGASLGTRALAVDEQLTSGALAAAVEALVGGGSDGPRAGSPPPPWYRRRLVWGVVGGVAAVALGVGLGVGLSLHDSGVATRVDLGPAR